VDAPETPAERAAAAGGHPVPTARARVGAGARERAW